MIRHLNLSSSVNDAGWPSISTDLDDTFILNESGNELGVVSIVKIKTLEMVKKVQTGHTNKITVTLSTRTGLVITGSEDCTARIFKSGSMELVGVLVGHVRPITKLHASSNGKIHTASEDKTIRRWDIATCQCEVVYIGHEHPITFFFYSSMAGQLFSCDEGGNEICWDDIGNMVAKVNDHGCAITGIIMLSSFVYVTSSARKTPGDIMGMIIARDRITFRTKCTWNIDSQVKCLADAPDNSTFFFGTESGKLCKVDNLSNTYEVCCTLNGPVNFIDMEGDGKTFVVQVGQSMRPGRMTDEKDIVPLSLMMGKIHNSIGDTPIDFLSNGMVMSSDGCLIRINAINTNIIPNREENTITIANPDSSIVLHITEPENNFDRWHM